MAGTRENASLHDRIRRDIEGRIMSGEWGPAFRIPYEHQLMEEYACSRMTVNKALSSLTERGLVERRKRAGTYVAVPKVHRAALDIADIRADVVASGRRYGFALIEQTDREATADDRTFLAMPRGRVVALSCVHYADGRPLALEDRLINLEQVPAAAAVNFESEPPGAWLMAHVPWSDARHRITAVNADTDIAARLSIRTDQACLSVERWTWRTSERITYVRQLFPGDMHGLEAAFRP